MNTYDLTMDKYELRRTRFIFLRDEFFEKSNATIARALGKDPSYIARIIFEQGKKGAKRIGEDMKDLIENKLGLSPGWLDAQTDKPMFRHESNVSSFAIPLVQIPSFRGFKPED